METNPAMNTAPFWIGFEEAVRRLQAWQSEQKARSLALSFEFV
jgi:hypothetical protein